MMIHPTFKSAGKPDYIYLHHPHQASPQSYNSVPDNAGGAAFFSFLNTSIVKNIVQSQRCHVF